MYAARVGSVVVVVALAAAGCGSSHRTAPRPTPKPTLRGGGRSAFPRGARPVSRAEERVIRAWASELRHGQVARAARAFALPVIVANGTDPIRLRTRAQAEAFNRSLPCGAVVVRFDRTAHDFVVTTFRLVERPGPGRCGSGVGRLARAAFLIRHGRIARWIRVADPPQPDQNVS